MPAAPRSHSLLAAGLVLAVLAALAPTTPARADDGPLTRFIVTYRAAGPVGAERMATASLPDDGSRVERTYATLPVVAVSTTENGLRRLEASPDVASVVPDRQLHTFGSATAGPAGIAPAALPKVTGAGWTVAVLDTGVDTLHPYVTSRIGPGFDGQGDSGACFAGDCPGGTGTATGVAAAQPCSGPGCDHGTHVAGIAVGVGGGGPGGMAPGAGLYPVRVFTTSSDPSVCGSSPVPCSTARESDVLAGLDHVSVQAAHYHFASVNMSLGDDGPHPAPCKGINPPIEAAIQQLSARGIAVAVAAGNHSSSNGISFPACAPGAIAVGALDTNGTVAAFSDASPGLALVAPGRNVLSSVPGGGFALKSGTSMAAPAVAGAFALVRQAAPGAALGDLVQLLRSTGTPAPDTRPDPDATYPALNIASALATVGYAPSGPTPGDASFHGLATPDRLVDTRAGVGGGRVPAGGTLAVTVPGVPSSPAGLAAASLNVTAVGADKPGFLTVFPCGQDTPLVSSVNYLAGAPVANKVVVAVPADGRVCIYSMAATDVLVDFDGWLAAGHPFQADTPHRVIDTRTSGVRVQDVAVTVVSPGARGAVVNLTVTNPIAAGFATLYPCGAPLPTASNLNFLAGGTVPGAALVPVDTTGRVCIHTSTPAHVIIDVAGSLTTGFVPQVPTRVLDTRQQGPPVTDVVLALGNLIGAEGIALTLTITEPTAAGYATVYPCGQPPPLASNVNFVAGQTIANAVVATPDALGQVCVHTFVPTHIVVDVSGWFT